LSANARTASGVCFSAKPDSSQSLPGISASEASLSASLSHLSVPFFAKSSKNASTPSLSRCSATCAHSWHNVNQKLSSRSYLSGRRNRHNPDPPCCQRVWVHLRAAADMLVQCRPEFHPASQAQESRKQFR